MLLGGFGKPRCRPVVKAEKRASWDLAGVGGFMRILRFWNHVWTAFGGKPSFFARASRRSQSGMDSCSYAFMSTSSCTLVILQRLPSPSGAPSACIQQIVVVLPLGSTGVGRIAGGVRLGTGIPALAFGAYGVCQHSRAGLLLDMVSRFFGRVVPIRTGPK